MFKLKFLVVFLICSFLASAQKYHRVKIDLQNQDINKLSAAGIAVDHGEYKKGFHFISDLSDAEINKVKSLGFKHEVLINDVEHHYIHQNDGLKNVNPHQSVLNTSSCKTCPQFQTPANFNLGSMGGFFTYQEMLDILDSMASKFPQLISQRQIIDTNHTVNGNQLSTFTLASNYQWTLNGVDIPGATNSILDITPPYGTYTCYTINTNGCISETAPIVIVLGLTEVISDKISIFPNPTSDLFQLKSSEPITSVKIYNNSGKEVFFNKIDSKTYSISHLPNGIYHVIIELESEKIYSKITRM